MEQWVSIGARMAPAVMTNYLIVSEFAKKAMASVCLPIPINNTLHHVKPLSTTMGGVV